MSKEDENNAPEVTPAMQKALDDGWRPQEDWKGDAEDWVDFKEFNLRGELMSRIKEQSGVINSLNHKIDERDKTLEDMASMQHKIAEREYNKALNDLKNQKAQALENNDYDGVVTLDDEISDLKANKPQPPEEQPQEPQQAGIPPEIQAWLNDPQNSWYHTDATMRAMAEGIAAGMQDLTPSEMLKRVDATMRRELPHRFESQQAASVDDGGEYTGDSSKGKSKKPTYNDLNDEQKAAAKRFERVIPDYTVEKYIDTLIEAGEL